VGARLIFNGNRIFMGLTKIRYNAKDYVKDNLGNILQFLGVDNEGDYIFKVISGVEVASVFYEPTDDGLLPYDRRFGTELTLLSKAEDTEYFL
jgi:hypothetical protein